MEVDEEHEEQVPQIPLFLHMTTTIRCRKDIVSGSIDLLPTCLANVAEHLPGQFSSCIITLPLSTTAFLFLTTTKKCFSILFQLASVTVLDLNDMKITLDFICLTFRSDFDELLPTSYNLRTTSFCSSSSGLPDSNSAYPTLASQMVR